MRYFRIIDSAKTIGRWWLGGPKTKSGLQLDPRLFTEGKKYAGQVDYPENHQVGTCLIEGKDYGIDVPLEIVVRKSGEPLMFTMGSFEMPIVNERVGEHLQACCGSSIQLIPACISGTAERYEILNVLSLVDAIDERRSEISRWTIDDGLPEKVGHYAGISKLVLSTEKMRNLPIMRLKNWELPLIISIKVKEVLESLQITGVEFKELEE